MASGFVVRHARRFSGLLVFSGGFIGPKGTPRRYEGTLKGTPVLIGCSGADPHIPIDRVMETTDVLANLGATVTKKVYSGMGHTIIQDEIDKVMKNMLGRVA